jgi:hypothetical protein
MLLWFAWAAGLLALFAPRPWGTTVLRVVAPVSVVVAVLTIPSTSGALALLAIATTCIATLLVLSIPVRAAAGNALAYGDEHRFPLRTPTPLLLGPIPVAIILVAGGVAAGPLLLANGQYVPGVLLLVAGYPIAYVVARALHALARRWLVVVPAGLALADPLTLVDAVLIRREHITAMRRTESTRLPTGAVDLRLGTLRGGIAIECGTPVAITRRRGRSGGEIMEADVLVVAVSQPDAAIAQAGARRIPTA